MGLDLQEVGDQGSNIKELWGVDPFEIRPDCFSMWLLDWGAGLNGVDIVEYDWTEMKRNCSKIKANKYIAGDSERKECDFR